MRTDMSESLSSTVIVFCFFFGGMSFSGDLDVSLVGERGDISGFCGISLTGEDAGLSLITFFFRRAFFAAQLTNTPEALRIRASSSSLCSSAAPRSIAAIVSSITFFTNDFHSPEANSSCLRPSCTSTLLRICFAEAVVRSAVFIALAMCCRTVARETMTVMRQRPNINAKIEGSGVRTFATERHMVQQVTGQHVIPNCF